MAGFRQILEILRNMGFRYVLFRGCYEVKRKTGMNSRLYPVYYEEKNFISLAYWRKECINFFFTSHPKNILFNHSSKLQSQFKHIMAGGNLYFSSFWLEDDGNGDWTTNPDTGYKYDRNTHWTEIEDIDKKAGDIKYVWEKSRFSFLYTMIRYDQHYKTDHAGFVFDRISDWIANNPLNCGPNYKCSQEISLRVLNWIFALYYYKDSDYLDEKLFTRIINSIYWQIRHVYSNINFSRIAVRNNHAITETLTLYLTGLLFPWFPDAYKWKRDGKRWFEQEIEYQIEEDGTYLQYSMNYHRVVVQLLTWAIVLADNNGEKFKDVVYERAYRSVNFLFQCQETTNGYLPNYGSNDGALFFPLNDNEYRDFRPQLDALHHVLTGKNLYSNPFEDRFWLTGNWKPCRKLFSPLSQQPGYLSFEKGGYYLIREQEGLTFIRCGGYKHRPAHADNLHIDVWYKGENILMDSGTYKYNADQESLNYFMGSAAHNTVMLDNYSQMLKGPRFIWYYWSRAGRTAVKETEDKYIFSGEVNCFRHLNKDIIHRREVVKWKGIPHWCVSDILLNKPNNKEMIQIWHTSSDRAIFQSDLLPVEKKGMYSSHYGEIKENKLILFGTKSNSITTNIKIQ